MLSVKLFSKHFNVILFFFTIIIPKTFHHCQVYHEKHRKRKNEKGKLPKVELEMIMNLHVINM